MSFLLFFLGVLSSFQRVNAQHCFPGFHFSIDANTVSFDDQSTADGNITAYSWDFGDGGASTAQNPSHSYSAPGTYNVCLTITAHNPNCSETYCHHVVVVHPPTDVCHAAFVAHQPDPAHTIIVFSDQSTSDGNIGSWVWDFGDGNTSTEQSPSHSYAEPGSYQVCLTITDADGGCTSHVCHHIVVHHLPAAVCHAAFVAHQTDPAHTTIVFTDQSTSDGAIGSWAWDFGDGNTSTEQNPSHTYAEPGTYQVCLTITDADGDCTSHVCHQVVVHHPPANVCHAAFAAHQPDPAHTTIVFTDQSTSDETIGSWTWDFGDGNTSTEQNPSYTYSEPGTYQVCLTVTAANGCTSHVCHQIVVHHPPAVDCQAAYMVHYSAGNLNIQFANTSTNTSDHTVYSWEFGDGTTSNEENPLHTYAHSGHYTVCLFIHDTTTGCSAHVCHTINVHHGGIHHYHPHHAHLEAKANLESKPRADFAAPLSVEVITYPNPFVGSTTIVYTIPVESAVKFEVYSVAGVLVADLAQSHKLAGEYRETLTVEDLQPGLYLLKMIQNGTQHVRPIILMR